MKSRIPIIILLLWPVIAIAQTVNIGDILCTDGSIISREAFAASGRTAEGIVFYVDNTDSQGWAISLDDQSQSIKWCSTELYGYNLPDLPNFANARTAMHDLNGRMNTTIIRSHGNSSDFPAAWAVDYANDWYLPSAGQLRYLYSYAPEINASLQVVGGTLLNYHGNQYWWSSTEFSEYHAYDMNTGGSIGDYVKDNHVNYPTNGIAVRQIRDFHIQNPTHPTYHIGDLITNDDGSQGILFYLSPDQTNGWMVALEDAATSVTWGDGDVPNLANQTCASPYGGLLDETDGLANTVILKDYQNGANTAANTVDYEHGWYLPTAGQLSKLFGALPFVEEPLEAHGTTLAQDEYWSSSEADADNAFTLSCIPSGNIRAGHFVRRAKTSNRRVRAVRNLSFANPPLPEPSLPDNIIENDCNRPIESTPWDIRLLHSSVENDIASYSPIVAGDIDGNGVTDIVAAKYTDNAYHSNGMYVFSGLDLSVQSCFDLPDTLYNYNGYALGRYPLHNGDLQGAIFIHSYDKRIRAYSADGTLLNVSDRATSCDGMLSLADFNGDGFPEIYSGNDIFDAATLKWLCSGPEDGNKGLGFRGPPLQTAVNTHHTYYAMSLAYNVLGDVRQELICGNTIYDVNIVSRTTPTLNSITINKTITPPSGFTQDGHVLIADFDLDGENEILVFRDNTDDHTIGNIYIYAYKPTSGQILFQKSHRAYCTSYPFIGNIDDDVYPEIVLLEKQQNNPAKLFCWRFEPENGLTTVWQQVHHDSSGQTGITLFDFNQDGIMELVYRDNQNLRILNGSGKSHITGNDTIRPYDLYQRMIGAGTGVEYPIVADVNGDGFAEIIATGLLGSTQEVGYGGIFIFGNPGNWSPARPVWNQYMYHVTNVNEDLTIPTYCFDKATVFTAPDGTVRRPYNNFLQQAYYINQYGEPYNPGEIVEIDIDGTGCNSFIFNDSTYTENGLYDQLIESPDGCDTIYHINVNLGEDTYHDFWRVHCYSYTWNDSTYTESGIYQQTFHLPEGCDSTAVMHLQILDTIRHEWSQTACNSYTWNGVTYTEPGDYVQHFEAEHGCDSIATLHLTFSDAMEFEADTIACGSFQWEGMEYLESGDYDRLFVTPGGCDSLIHMHLTIAPFPEDVPEIDGPTEVYVSTDLILGQYFYSIDSVGFADRYEWELEGVDWPLDTTGLNCALWVTTPGTATLRVKAWNGCGFSEREIIIHGGFYDIDEQAIPVAVYPNPAHDHVFIEAKGMRGIKMYNFQGQCVIEKNISPCDRLRLSLQDFRHGLYFIEVQTELGTGIIKLRIDEQ